VLISTALDEGVTVVEAGDVAEAGQGVAEREQFLIGPEFPHLTLYALQRQVFPPAVADRSVADGMH